MKLPSTSLLLLLIGLCFVNYSCKTSRTEINNTSLPNILVIHVDDLGFHDLSYNGSEIYQTPNIDKLASESIVFNNAYANYPRCVPSRLAMMTAAYPIQNGKVPDDGYSLSNIPEDRNLIKKINTAGYQTAYFGKWHLGSEESSPKGFGFDYSFAAGKAGSPISFHYPYNTPKGKNKNVRKARMLDAEEVSKDGDYLTDILTSQVIKYTNELERNRPFFTILAYYAVHQPLEAKEEDIKRNKKEIAAFDYGAQPEYIAEGTGRTKMRQDNPQYAAMVENLDVNIGKILQNLEARGLTENTVIVFSSDHGGLSNDGYNQRHLATSNYPLRAGKGWMYDGGIKVPLFVKWQKMWTPREDNTSLVMLMDLLPTLADFAGVNNSPELDGKTFLPVIEGKEDWSERAIYWHAEKARPNNTGESKSSAIRSGGWKLIDFYEKDIIELYNLTKDPYEKNNLAEDYPDKKMELLSLLNQWKNNS